MRGVDTQHPDRPTAAFDRLAAACLRIADSSRFQTLIITAIVLNAIVLGLETYETLDDEIGGPLRTMNAVFLGVFTVELAIRLVAYGRRPQDFFRSGWNVFDFVVIGM